MASIEVSDYEEAQQVINKTADLMEKDRRDFDHSIWKYVAGGSRMTFNELLHSYYQHFPWNGSFELWKGENLRTRATEAKVPDDPGVYLIYGYQGGEWKLLYIGRSGALHSDGTFSDQKLLKRITKANRKGCLGVTSFKSRWTNLALKRSRLTGS